MHSASFSTALAYDGKKGEIPAKASLALFAFAGFVFLV